MFLNRKENRSENEAFPFFKRMWRDGDNRSQAGCELLSVGA